MSLTLLLDLDSTLLDSNIDVLIPAYFEKLAGFLAPWVEPNLLIKELLAGSRLMLKNQRPDLMLDQVFAEYFFPAIGVEREQIQPELERFYDEVFPTLKSFTAPRAEAVEIVDYAFAQNWRVVIATNPLFPRKAIEHRLRWANLPPENYPFRLITSMENSHFTKAVPAYYTEILGSLGWESEPVLMVGDDLQMDVESAARAGLPIYWIRPEGSTLPELRDAPQGTLADFKGWIQAVELDTLQPGLKNPEAITSTLQSAPAVLDTLLRRLHLDEWTIRPQADEWTITEILCHLRDLDLEVNLPRIENFLTTENPFITGQNTDPWAKERNYIAQDGPTAFRDFVRARMELVEKLKNLSPEGWQQRGRHTIFGPTQLQELMGFVAEHDRTHIQQAITIQHTVQSKTV